ncbi:hypothetical protein VTN96DRAFT_2628 [Rasamsonia emersonii]
MAELTGQSQSSGQSESLAENTQPAIEVDPQATDRDPTYLDELLIDNYRNQCLPNDEEEADRHRTIPSAEVIGSDLSPQPSEVPSNVKFCVHDIEDEWVYETPFDFIHVRNMAYSIKDFRKLLKQCFNYY